MTFLKVVSKRKKIGLVSIALLAILLASGALSSSLGTFGESTGISSYSNVQSTSTVLPAAAPTFVGNAHAFLSGPILVPPAFGSVPPPSASNAIAPNTTIATSHVNLIPTINLKPLVGKSSIIPSAPPTVKCPGSGCVTISTASGGAMTQAHGLDAVDNGASYGYDVEPSDQGLCANSQYVMEVLNWGEAQVYSASDLRPIRNGYATLDGLMGLTSLNWGSAGDVSCMYDFADGGHWFITEIVSASPEPLSPFTGCFARVLDTCREGLAVSVTDNPMGSYNVYFLDNNKVNKDPGVGYLYPDFGKIGSTQDALLLFYDEVSLTPAPLPTCPAFGCTGFNGAQEFAFGKIALESGLSANKVDVAYENMGNSANLYPIPSNGNFQPAPASCFTGSYAGAICWGYVIPAQTPDPSQYNNNNGGTGYMVGSLDFIGAGDNRLATFAWEGLSNLNSPNCSSCVGITFGGRIFTSQVAYMDEGSACLVQYGGFCGLGDQKAGPIPLGDNCYLRTSPPGFPFLPPPISQSCPENGIATNGDIVTQASYADGELWTAVSSVVTQSSGTTELHLGATFWDINAGGKSLSIAKEGYVSAAREDLEMPAIAATDNSEALMTFTLSGDEGANGGYYPSSAYIIFSDSSSVIHVTALGESPHDGYSEYLSPAGSYPSSTEPRWGDYSWAIFVPGSHGGIYFATNYIEYPNCSDQAFLKTGGTCGGTRDLFANWGSSVSVLR